MIIRSKSTIAKMQHPPLVKNIHVKQINYSKGAAPAPCEKCPRETHDYRKQINYRKGATPATCEKYLCETNDYMK